MASIVPDPSKIRAFPTEAAFEHWLAKHHDKESEVFVRMYKKGTNIPTVSPKEAIDVALCWGWIDGIRKSYDEESFLQRLTPRRAKSVWSQINRDNVARLLASGRMTEHGMKHVEAAKADGRWDAAYAPASTMTMPEDLLAAIRANPRALSAYEKLNKQNTFALAFRLGNLRTKAARERKIAEFVSMLEEGKTLHPMSESTESKKRTFAKARSRKNSGQR